MTRKPKDITGQTPTSAVDDEVRNMMKLRTLLPDFEELQKETENIRKTLRRAKRKKQILMAEVRFLRRRYQYLLMNQRTSTDVVRRREDSEVAESSYVKDKKQKGKEAVKRTPPLLDLNQISDTMGGEEIEEFQVAWEPLQIDKQQKRCLVDAETLTNDLNLSVCRNVGNGHSRNGKRKITWQDQVALRV